MPGRERKRVSDHRSNILKGSLLQGPPAYPRPIEGPCESERFRRRIRFVQFSMTRKHVMRDRVVTDYIQNEKYLTPDRALGDPRSQK